MYAFAPLLTLHAISDAATMTETTTRTTTTAITTAPMITPDTCVEEPPPTVTEGNWAGSILLLLEVESPATESWYDGAARGDDATLLGETLVSSVNVAAAEVLGRSGATNVTGVTELLVISGTAHI